MSQTTGEEVRVLQPNDPYKRSTLACNNCRRRKTKCLGGEPCPTCHLAGQECIYEEAADRSVRVSRRYLDMLETCAKTLESQRRECSVPNTTASWSSKYDTELEDIDSSWTEGMENLVITSSGQHQYRGPSSSTSLGIGFRKFVIPQSENLAMNAHLESRTYNENAWPRRPSVSILPELPRFEFAKRLQAAQHMYIGTIFSFVEPLIFDKRLQSVYSQPPDLRNHEECLAYCQVLMVLAYGQMYSVNQWLGNDGPPGFQYFMQALQILPDIHEEGSILFVEVLSLVGYYMQNLNRRDAAFLYIGSALRMAISLGLHQEVADYTLDSEKRERRRRVWWSVYSMDRILCVKSGNPITIADEDIGVSLPSPIPNIDTENWSASVLSHYTQLSRILGKIMEGIYRKSPKSGPKLLATVHSIMAELSSWLRNLPKELHFNFKQLEQSISRESVSVFLHYYQCINMTARPLLFHVVQTCLKNMITNHARPDWREGLSAMTVSVIETCTKTARSTITMMSFAAKQNLVATYGFMDGEHAFSAALVLVMITVAFPFNAEDGAAMDAALELLREMAERGNSHVRARYLLLMDLRSVIGQVPLHQYPSPVLESRHPRWARKWWVKARQRM